MTEHCPSMGPDIILIFMNRDFDSEAPKNNAISFQTVFLGIIICERKLEKTSPESEYLGLYCIACV